MKLGALGAIILIAGILALSGCTQPAEPAGKTSLQANQAETTESTPETDETQTEEPSEPTLDLCANVTCPDSCDGTTRNHNGKCVPSTGECQYDRWEKATECGYKEITRKTPSEVILKQEEMHENRWRELNSWGDYAQKAEYDDTINLLAGYEKSTMEIGTTSGSLEESSFRKITTEVIKYNSIEAADAAFEEAYNTLKIDKWHKLETEPVGEVHVSAEGYSGGLGYCIKSQITFKRLNFLVTLREDAPSFYGYCDPEELYGYAQIMDKRIE